MKTGNGMQGIFHGGIIDEEQPDAYTKDLENESAISPEIGPSNP